MNKSAMVLVLPLALSACGAASGGENQVAPSPTAGASPSAGPMSAAALPAAIASPVAAAARPGILSCRADVGAAAAARLATTCRNVSPATRPPCNVANSCAMIEDEIARSCAAFDGKGTPMKGCTPAPASMEAAAAVVRRYYSAINAHDFSTAWSQWGEDGQPGRTYAAFAAGFAGTRGVRVAIGQLTPGDGGAGSIYQPVPVTVDSTLADGTHQRFAGTYVVRRINGVDGASPAQLRWHLASATLKRVPMP